jgi:hypothetical protein
VDFRILQRREKEKGKKRTIPKKERKKSGFVIRQRNTKHIHTVSLLSFCQKGLKYHKCSPMLHITLY